MSFRNVPFILLSRRFYLQRPRTRLALRRIGMGTDMAHSHICNAIKDLGNDGENDGECTVPKGSQLQYIRIL